MAGKAVVFLLLCLNCRVFAGIEDIDLKYTQPAATFDELYNDGIEKYSKKSWPEAVRSFQLALADYKHEREVRSNCILQCREKIDKSDILRKGKHDGGTLILYYVIRLRRCADLCQEKFMGRRGPIARFIRDAFEKREPYNYLQFSYYKLKQYQKAADAALTYLERNPNDKIVQKNLNLFMAADRNVNFNGTQSMERQHHIDLFMQGDDEYANGKHTDCILTFEEALDEYYRAHRKCLALCEYQHEKHQASFSVALFQHYMAIVQCRLGCYDDLSLIKGSKHDKFLEVHYHYLQFCYHANGRVKEAAENAKTYLLFDPEDPIMRDNYKYYLGILKLNTGDIQTRKRAEELLKQRRLDKKLLAVAKYYANPDVIFDDKMEDIDSIVNDENLIHDNEADNENRDLSEEAKVAKKKPKNEEGESREHPKKEHPKKLSNILKIPKKWKKNPRFKGVQLSKEGKQLNGTGRFVVDKMASEQECKTLANLVQKLMKNSNGTKASDRSCRICGKENLENCSSSHAIDWLDWNYQCKLANFGDGYKHNHPDPKHPFTEKESFEGVNIRDTVMAALNGEITLDEAELYANLSDKMRAFVEEYFELKQPLFISYTHLVCRTAYADAAQGDHISHPVHSDNCLLGLDGPGTCPKVSPAYTWRDYSGVLYLNGGFDGGEFIFTDPDGTQQAAVKPKCGRMVAFSGGIENIHGVLGIKSGRRCALPLWFTLSEDKIEDNRGRYQAILNELRMARNKQEGASRMASETTKEGERTFESIEDGSGNALKSEL